MKYALLVIVGLAAIGAAALVFTHMPSSQIGETRPPLTSMRTQPLSEQQAESRIERLGLGVVVLARPGRPLRIRVDPQTQITFAGQLSQSTALQVGQWVRVTYEVSSGPPHATRIEVLSAPEAPPKS